jgi:hypothetical protein
MGSIFVIHTKICTNIPLILITHHRSITTSTLPFNYVFQKMSSHLLPRIHRQVRKDRKTIKLHILYSWSLIQRSHVLQLASSLLTFMRSTSPKPKPTIIFGTNRSRLEGGGRYHISPLSQKSNRKGPYSNSVSHSEHTPHITDPRSNNPHSSGNNSRNRSTQSK